MSESGNKKRKIPPGSGIAMGIALGLVFGLMIDSLPIGIALGVAFGAAFDGMNARKDKNGGGTDEAA